MFIFSPIQTNPHDCVEWMEPFFFTFAGIYYNFCRLRLKVVVVVIVVVACSQKTVFCLPFRFLFFFPNGLRPTREPFQPAYQPNQPSRNTHLSSTAAYNTIFVCEGSDNIDKMPKPVLRFFLFHFEKKISSQKIRRRNTML